MYSGKNLKDKNIYGQNTNVYINNSFCKEFGFLNYLIRKAKKSKAIVGYKIKHGVTSVQTHLNGEFMEISHKNDLIKIGIDVPDDNDNDFL